MQHYVTLLFDVEDLCWPGSDDIPRDLAQILRRNDVPGTFFVVGEKARLWQRRGRQDVIDTLAPFDIGLHTNLHSIHPTVSEYLAPYGWEDGVEEAMRRDAPGFATIQEVWGRPASSWGQAGGTWGPQIHAALVRAGIPCAVYPGTHTARSDVNWYGGALTFPEWTLAFFDSAMLDAGRFDASLEAMWARIDRRIGDGQTWTGIFACHPTMLRATQFWDQLNFAAGQNTDPSHYRMPELHPEASYRLALQNFETLVQALRADSRLTVTTIADLRRVYRAPEGSVTPEVLRAAAQEFTAAAGDIPTDNPALSPAEAVYLMARALVRDAPREQVRREVYGPADEPPADAIPRLEWDALLSACRGLVEHVEATGHLPADAGSGHGLLPIGSFGRAMAEGLLARDRGESPDSVTLRGGHQVPQIADAIVERVQGGFRGWPVHDPQLDTTRLLLHTRLQCWTLRPALPDSRASA